MFVKVCHLTSVHQYNDIRIFVKECKSLAKAGFDVHLVAPNAPDEVIDGVQLHGVTIESNSRLKRMTKTTDRVYKKALEIEADLYHFHDPELIPIGLKLKKYGKKVIYDIHEDVPRAILSKYWISSAIRKPIASIFEIYENFCAKKFDCLLTATPYIKKRFERINSNTVNINNFPLLNELMDSDLQKSTKKNNSVCYVGGIGILRGVSQLLDSADLVDGTIDFAGPISSKEVNLRMHTKKNVNYLGILNRNEVKNLLSNSVAGIVTFLPEPNHINSQPNKMFEYMSAGIPVICSDFPLWREIIVKNDCGICVNPENPTEIANAINFLLNNPEEVERMGTNGRKAVETEYNWETESKKLISVYKSL